MKWETNNDQCALIINKDELTTKFNLVVNGLASHTNYGKLFLMITCPTDKNMGQDLPYCYTADEIKRLNQINSLLERAGHHDSILFNEGYDYSMGVNGQPLDCWSLGIVLEVNKKIHRIAEKIKDLGLTPYETLLAIHQMASEMTYSGSATGGLGRESEATLIGISDNFRHLCCVGYASFVKAVIDILNDPNLVAYVDNFVVAETDEQLYKQTPVYGHTINMIEIHDPVYKIDGFYFEDATALKNQSEPTFHTCLIPIPDMSNISRRIYRHSPTKTPKDNVHIHVPFDENFFDAIENLPSSDRIRILRDKFEWLPFKDSTTKKFNKLYYTYYDIETFEQAYTSLLAKIGEENIAEKVAKAMEETTMRAARYYNHQAENCFAYVGQLNTDYGIHN